MLSLKLAPARILYTSLTAIAFFQNGVALAAPPARANFEAGANLDSQSASAFIKPKNLSQAIDMVNEAKRRKTESYFPLGGTQAEVDAFANDIRALTEANRRVDFVSNASEFGVWFKENQTSILMNRKKMNTDNLQGLLVETYIAFRAEQADKRRNTSGFLLWIKDTASQPKTLLAGGAAAAYGTYAFFRDVGKGAMIAGPANGFLSAYLEPIVRPIREKLSVVGNRHFGSMGKNLNHKLNEEKASLMETRAQIDAREAARKATTRIMLNMGYDMTSDQSHANMEELKRAWSDAKNVWESTNTAMYRDGRGLMAEFLILRPVYTSGGLLPAVAGAETFRQGIENTIDRIKQVSSNPPEVVRISDKLLQTVKQTVFEENNDAALAKSRAAATADLKGQLLTLGANAEQVDRLISNQRKELVFYRHAAATLAGDALYELMYSEFNRALPNDISKQYEIFKGNYCFDFFHQEFRVEVAKQLNQLGLQLKASAEVIDKQIAAIDAKIAELTPKEAAKKADDSKPAASTRTGVEGSSALKSRVHFVLRQILAHSANERLAIAPKDQGESKRKEADVAESVRAAAARARR